jgi:hypothetical protein
MKIESSMPPSGAVASKQACVLRILWSRHAEDFCSSLDDAWKSDYVDACLTCFEARQFGAVLNVMSDIVLVVEPPTFQMR